jgi:uncharacterized protein
MKSIKPSRPVQAALVAACLSFAAAASAQQAPSAEKQKLVQRALALWHVEDAAVAMAQRPAAEAVQQARIALQGRVPAAKQESTLKEMAPDVQKFVDEVTPIVRDNAVRLKEPVLGPLLAQNFSEEELKQLIAMLESPVKKKFEQLVPQLERAYGERIAADSRAAVDPKLQAMTQAVGSRLRAASIAR